jgi:hypothetical protein
MFGMKKTPEKKLPEFSSSTPSMSDYRKPQLPAFEMENPEEIHRLPSFPDSPMNKGFSQSAIKSAIEEDKNLPELPEWIPENKENDSTFTTSRTKEMDEWKPQRMEFPNSSLEEIRNPPKINTSVQNTMTQKKHLFVKLEKFKESRESLTKISEKLDQMEDLLKMIKEVKAKEDAEITEWEKDIENIKSRISFINREIFENAY